MGLNGEATIFLCEQLYRVKVGSKQTGSCPVGCLFVMEIMEGLASA